MLFTPFFLNRQQNKSACAAVNGKIQEFHPQLAKISYIHEESLKLVPCTCGSWSEHSDGVPFDIGALIASLTIKKDRSILPFLLQELLTKHSSSEEVLLLCPGSIVDGKIPFIVLPLYKGEEIQVGEVEKEYQFTPDFPVYQLIYTAA